MILSETSYAIALILSEHTVSCHSPHIYSPWSLSGHTVDFQNGDMCFTNCHTNRDVGTIHAWNDISQISINCITIINDHTNIYYIHEKLHILIVITISRSHHMALVGAFRSRAMIASILSICIAMILFCISGGILSHCLKRSWYVPTEMSDTCVQNGVLNTFVCIHFKYHAEETATSLVVQGILYCSGSK
jgi:hypothetical protein